MKAFYQNASIGECVDVQFENRFTPIRLSPQYVREGVIVSGWEVTVDDFNQVWIVSIMILETLLFLLLGAYTSCSGAVYR